MYIIYIKSREKLPFLPSLSFLFPFEREYETIYKIGGNSLTISKLKLYIRIKEKMFVISFGGNIQSGRIKVESTLSLINVKSLRIDPKFYSLISLPSFLLLAYLMYTVYIYIYIVSSSSRSLHSREIVSSRDFDISIISNPWKISTYIKDKNNYLYLDELIYAQINVTKLQ